MKNYVFIVTNNENHWSDMTNILKEKAIPFYPEKIEDFNKLRNYCNFDHCIKKECSTKARNEIKKIISKLPKKFSCIIRFQITEGDVLEKGILFSKFYEDFLIDNPEVKLVVYFNYGDSCICDHCIEIREYQQKLAIDYCAEKGITFYYWSAKGSHFFVKDRSEFLSVKNRKELSIDMLL